MLSENFFHFGQGLAQLEFDLFEARCIVALYETNSFEQPDGIDIVLVDSAKESMDIELRSPV